MANSGRKWLTVGKNVLILRFRMQHVVYDKLYW